MVKLLLNRAFAAIILLGSISLCTITASLAYFGDKPGERLVSPPTPALIEAVSKDGSATSLNIVGNASGMLEPLTKMNALVELSPGSHLTAADLSVLARCPNLKVVSIEGSDPSDADLLQLAKSKSIQRIALFAPRVTGAGILALVRNMPQLQEINEPKTGGDDYLQAVAKLPKMTWVEVPDDATLAGIRQLKGHPGMRGVYFKGPVDDHAILAVGASDRLDHLLIWKGTLTDKGISYIVEQFPNLEHLTLCAPSVKGHNLDRLSALTRLKVLNVRGIDFDELAQKKLQLLKANKALSIEYSKDLDNDADISVVEIDAGCQWHHEKKLDFYKKKHDYVSPLRTVSGATIAELKQVILDSRKYSQLDLPTLGVSAEMLHSMEPALRAAMSASNNVGGFACGSGYGEIFEQFNVNPELPDMEKALMAKPLNLGMGGGYWLTVRLKGDPKIRISTSWDRDWLIPWDVQVGDQKWASYSPEISRCLKDIVQRTDGYFKHYTDDSKYWTEEVWKNDAAWSTLKRDLLTKNAARIAQSMDGYAELSKKFALSGQDSGSSEQLAISYVLTPRSESWMLDSGKCRVLFDQGKPQGTWTQRAAEFANLDKVVRLIPAIVEWKSASTKNQVSAWLPDESPTHVAALRVLKARWRKANLPGTPEWIFSLECEGKPVAVVAASEGSDKVLVGQTDPERVVWTRFAGPSGFWLYCHDADLFVANKNDKLLK